MTAEIFTIKTEIAEARMAELISGEPCLELSHRFRNWKVAPRSICNQSREKVSW
jgi:hypothetical protein